MLEDFNTSYAKLLRSFTENLDLDLQDTAETVTKANGSIAFEHSKQLKPPDKLKSVLLGRNWNLPEISQYDYWSHESKDFASTSLCTFMLALCAEYVYLLFYENIITNELAEAVLTKIFTSAIQLRLQYPEVRGKSHIVIIETLQVILKTNIMKAAELNVIGILHEPVRHYIDNYSLKKKNFLNNRFVGGQVIEVMNCISSINPPLVRRNQ